MANGRPQSGPTPLVPSAIVLQLPPRGPRWITISNLPGSSPAPPTGVRQPDLRPALPLGVALRVVVSALQHYQRCPGLISEHLHRGTPPGSLGLQSLCCNRRAHVRPPIIGPWPVWCLQSGRVYRKGAVCVCGRRSPAPASKTFLARAVGPVLHVRAYVACNCDPGSSSRTCEGTPCQVDSARVRGS